ncbi:porin [Vibrio sp. La 4.2.2]|uniref:porin n=1 Tax=Vibrio sp. La 4.2.2 TaxID=2998830 RepID=UPI0022CDF555|nr:porin [Vibrio sp. La 4.2.2]MDA0106657.1 porin [Vibrio sp. La 4.2.2]
MKMAAIATAITTALVSGSALAAEVYNSDGTSLNIGGRAEFRGDFIGKSSGAELDGSMDNNSRFRLNVGGNTQITNDLSGFAFYEAEQGVNSDGSGAGNSQTDNFKQRYMYAGLQTNFGAISFGRQDTALVQLSQMSDIATYTGAQKEFIDAGNEQANNNILYTGMFADDALSLKANAILSDEKDQNSYGISGIYTLPMGLGIGLGYAGGDEWITSATDTAETSQFMGGLSYAVGQLYVAGTYTQGKVKESAGDVDFTGYEFAGQYKFDNGFVAQAVYAKQDVDDNVSKYDKNNYVELTGKYYFNNSIHSYLSYKFNMLEKDKYYINGQLQNRDADDSLRLGLRYDF